MQKEVVNWLMSGANIVAWVVITCVCGIIVFFSREAYLWFKKQLTRFNELDISIKLSLERFTTSISRIEEKQDKHDQKHIEIEKEQKLINEKIHQMDKELIKIKYGKN